VQIVAGIEIKKSSNGWFGVKSQSPSPRLEVFSSGNPDNPDLVYEAGAKDGVQSKLMGYTFSEATDDLGGSFTFTVENEETGGDGKTVFDAIPIRSVVKIFEADEKQPAFVGIIKRRHIKSSMTAQGPKRTIVFSGKSIISVIAEYMVSFDLKIMNVPNAVDKTRDLKDKINKMDLPVKDFMTITWDFFLEMGTGTNAIGATKMGELIEKFVGAEVGGCITGADGQNIHYPVANIPFAQSDNVIGDLWRAVLPQPVYEIFAFCDIADGKPKIMARESPFSAEDWLDLDIYEIDPLDLIDYDLTQSDDEVYTAFYAYLTDASMSMAFNIAKDQEKKDDVAAYDEDKIAVYGYKPLEIYFRGYDRSRAETDDRKSGFKELNEKARYWYGRLDDMFSGTITLLTDFTGEKRNGKDGNPRAGYRARFLGGEFYINKTEHRWNYGGAPTITLSVSRGMAYDRNSGEMTGVIPEIGKRFKELE
jgi:hypothetical protein